jgi:hypothetical protein
VCRCGPTGGARVTVRGLAAVAFGLDVVVTVGAVGAVASGPDVVVTVGAVGAVVSGLEVVAVVAVASGVEVVVNVAAISTVVAVASGPELIVKVSGVDLVPGSTFSLFFVTANKLSHCCHNSVAQQCCALVPPGTAVIVKLIYLVNSQVSTQRKICDSCLHVRELYIGVFDQVSDFW